MGGKEGGMELGVGLGVGVFGAWVAGVEVRCF